MQFAEKLKLWREERVLSQKQAAEMLEITRPYFSDFENGKRRPTEKVLKKFREATGGKFDNESDATIAREEPREAWPAMRQVQTLDDPLAGGRFMALIAVFTDGMTAADLARLQRKVLAAPISQELKEAVIEGLIRRIEEEKP